MGGLEMDEYSILRKKKRKNAFVATALLISIAIALLVMVGAVLVLSKVNDNDHITTSDNSTGTEKAGNNSTTCEGLMKIKSNSLFAYQEIDKYS